MTIPTVALIGRVNVGKSTLQNRLSEQKTSIVSDIPGTTRDRTSAQCIWRGETFRLVDSGGLERKITGEIDTQILAQTRLAMQDADVLAFVIDSTAGVVPGDRRIARELRKSKKPILVVLNKIDRVKSQAERESLRADALHLGFGEPVYVSAISGRESGDLLDAVYEKLPKKTQSSPSSEFALAILGKPNVGKSTIMNAIAGMERSIVSSEPHTTRDPQEHIVTFEKKRITILDTAGIRRKSRVGRSSGTIAGSIERESVKKSTRALEDADVAILVLDIAKRITVQDTHLAGLILDEKKGLIIIANKWDLIPDKTSGTHHEYEKYIRRQFPFLAWAPIIFVSALEKKRVHDILKTAISVHENLQRTITESELSAFIKTVKTPLSMPVQKLAHVRHAPHIFRAEFGGREGVPLSVQRRVVNQLRAHFDFEGAPVQLRVNQPKRKRYSG